VSRLRLIELERKAEKRRAKARRQFGDDAVDGTHDDAIRIGGGGGGGGSGVAGVAGTDKTADAAAHRRARVAAAEVVRQDAADGINLPKKRKYLKGEQLRAALSDANDGDEHHKGGGSRKAVQQHDALIRSKTDELRRRQRAADREAAAAQQRMTQNVRRKPLLVDSEARARQRLTARVDALWKIKESLDKTGVTDYTRFFDQEELDDLHVDFSRPRPADDYASSGV
jgi:hypothetical protein